MVTIIGMLMLFRISPDAGIVYFTLWTLVFFGIMATTEYTPDMVWLLATVADPRTNPISPPGDFESFTGRYYHDGFEEVHEVSLRENKLRVDIPSPVRDLVWGELTPVAGDLFIALIEGEPSCTNVTVKFLRDGDGRVTALPYSINRCRDVVFHKLMTGQKTHEPS